MQNSESVLSVRFNSTLSEEKLMATCQEDLDRFRAVPGLLQKYYIVDEATGAISGFYVFQNRATREAFWNSELAKSIPARYGVVPKSLRVEHYEMAIVMNDLLSV